MDPVNVPAKFDVCSLTVPEIKLGAQKKEVHVYAHAPFSPKF